MSATQQPEALRLAHTLSGGKLIDDSTEWADTLHAASEELRHQHARIAELEAQLSAIGAGGVLPLRKQAAVPQGWKLVQIELLERIQESLGSFLSDQGWSQSDMDTADALAGLLAAAPQASPHGMEQDAARYQALVESGNFAPSPFDNGMWGLRVSSVPSTKAELDAAVDRVIAAQAKQGGM